jgi:indolepyruvate ferredoxin oxidoreductase
VLRDRGLKQKIALGPWFKPGFQTLRAMKRLRGTRLDPFGHTAVRRVERELIGEYRALLKDICARLTLENHATAVALAALPDMVRGYEQIKLDNVERYRAAMRDLLAQMEMQEQAAD